MSATSVAGNEIFDIVVQAELYVKYQADSKQKTTIERAATYLYQAKRTGRNRVCSAANLGLELAQSC